MLSKTIDLDGNLIHYADFGGVGRAIVLVHGLGGSHANWLAVGPMLAEHHRVVALDLPGFGLSKRAAGGATLDVMGAALSRFIDAMSNDPVHLMGNSMGGALSVLEASKRPERIQSALLVCPALPLAPGKPRLDRAFLTTLALACAPFGHLLLRRRSARIGPRQMVHELLRLCCVDPTRVPLPVVEAHLELASSRPSRPWADLAFAEATRSLTRCLFSRRAFMRAMKSLRVPTLILQGEADRLVDVRAARAAVSQAPQVELQELANLGHTPQLEAPETFVELASAWMSRFESSGPAR